MKKREAIYFHQEGVALESVGGWGQGVLSGLWGRGCISCSHSPDGCCLVGFPLC